MELSRDDIKYIIEEAVKRTLSYRYIPIHSRMTMDYIRLDEAVIRSIPKEKVVKHFISTYNFAYDYNFDTTRYPGAITTATLNNKCETIILFLDSETKIKFCQEEMAKMGWILSKGDMPITDLDGFKAFQFEKKKDIEATERVMQSRYIYHYSSNNPNIIANIKHQGLCPTMKSWEIFANTKDDIENIRKPSNEHLDYSRIYFFLQKPKDNFNPTEYFQYKNTNNNLGYRLLKIDTKKLLPNTYFYWDPRQENAVYTQSNIPPSAIEFIE